MQKSSRILAAAGVVVFACAIAVVANENAPDVKPAESSLSGNWLATLKVGAVRLRLAVAVTAKPNGSFAGTLNSLDQDAVAHRLDEASLKEKTVRFVFRQSGFVYEGTLNDAGTEIVGKMKQGGAAFPLVFKRTERAAEGRKRPQEPRPPYPYRVEEVKFENAADHAKFAGTLTVPHTPARPPAVLLVTGSGQQDRDETVAGHRPFLVLADFLSRHGIAVLRVDDRGVGGSTGDVANATTEDFARDARAALEFLRGRPDLDARKIGILGHSEGGIIAATVGANSKDVAFVVMLAGPGLPGDQILLLQMVPLLKQAGAPDSLVGRVREYQQKLYAAIKGEPQAAALTKRIKAIFSEFEASLTEAERKQAGVSAGSAEASARTLGSPWFRFFLSYDPRSALAKVQCPVLALIGEKDQQVPPKENLPEIEKALHTGGNKDFTVRELPGLNHLFQTCRTGAVTEYVTIEETFAPSALELIADWIQKRTSADAVLAP